MAAKRQRKARPSGAPLDLNALHAAIEDQQADWEAGATDVAQIAAINPDSLLGLVVDEKELEATEAAIQAASKMQQFAAEPISAPASIDWRSNGGNFVTSVKNQLSCGSCVSFGTIATIESRINVACRNPSASPDLSEAHLFYCGCGNCCGTGWQFTSALNFCKSTGVALDSSFPYTPGNQPCKTGVAIYAKIAGYTSVLTPADRKNAIVAGGPVVAGMAVYNDFFSYRSGVYRHVTGNLAGYHAVSVVGYNDGQGCWIAKNSWGTGWGESGFFRIAYGQSDIDTRFPFYVPQVACPQPVNPCASAQALLTRVLVVARLNASLRACLRYYVCGRGPRPLCTPPVIAVVRQVVTILQRCPQYRRSFCTAIA